MKRPILITLLILALALVCTGIGAVVFFTAKGGFPTNNPFDVRNISSALEESKTLTVDPQKSITLNVVDEAGTVTVTGDDVDTVQVKAIKTAFDSSQARADEEVKGIKYAIEQNGNAITLQYQIPESMNFRNRVNTVDFIITVPNETIVDIQSNMGEVSVTGTTGNVNIDCDFGAVTLENIEGALFVQTNGGEVNAMSIKAGNRDIELASDFGAVTLKDANGRDITLHSNSGTISLREVRATGDISAKTDFGSLSFENGSADSLSIDTKSGQVILTKVRVNQAITAQTDFGEIELEQAAASSYDLHTNSGSIHVDSVKGKLKAYTDFGGINVQNAQTVTLDLQTKSGTVEFNGSLGTGPHIVQTDFGEISLTLPADAELNVDLSTKFGKIKSDLPITVTLTETSNSDGDQIVGSINGGGEQLTAQTNSGSVNLYAEK